MVRTCRANSKFTYIHHFYTNTCNFAGCQSYATYTRKNYATTCTEIFANTVTITASSDVFASLAFTKVFTEVFVTSSSVLSTLSGFTEATGIVHWLFQLFYGFFHRNRQILTSDKHAATAVMEILDKLITVLSGPSERLLEVVDQTPVTLSVDQNQTPSLAMTPGNPSVDSQSPVLSENPDLSRFQPEEIFSLRQKAVSAKNFAVLLVCDFFFQPCELVSRKVWGVGKRALNPSRIDTIEDLVFRCYPTPQGEREMVWRNCRIAVGTFLLCKKFECAQ